MEDISKRCKVVVLNGGRLDFDKKLDFSDLSAIADVTKYDDSTPMTSEILARVAGHDVVITKEITVPSEVLALFPSSVKLICEAGTGYNNHDCALARYNHGMQSVHRGACCTRLLKWLI
jgi:glycerate dehydrogenase